ncbi:MAG: SpoVR family protein [Candidatus Nanohaloarchaea archaeon]|nr:SpoVR family protein [Candidatus Nanohaloarchaea archaeon]
MIKEDEYRLREAADELRGLPEEANELSEKLGLEPYDVNYWVVDYDDINEVAAYGGFQKRYPHWRFGMKYDRQKKKSDHLGGKILEMVINDDPSEAYLQESNDVASQKGVITHVEAHSDFFAQNDWYQMFREDPDSAAMLARHADRIEDYMKDKDIGEDGQTAQEAVEEWIDHALTIEDNIDQHVGYRAVMERAKEEGDYDKVENMREAIEDLGLSDQVQEEVFDEGFYEHLEEDEDHTVPSEPQEDLLYFLMEHGKQYDAEEGMAREMEDWQEDVLNIIRKESYYFAPQKMTKVMNEGWASYWDSMMMTNEGFADYEDLFDHAAGEAAMLDDSNGFNPYTLGIEIWEHIENTENREEVVQKLLQVENDELDLTDRNIDDFYDKIDFDQVYDNLEPGEAERQLYQASFDNLADIEELVEEGELDEDKVDMDNLERAKEIREMLDDDETINSLVEATQDSLSDIDDEEVVENGNVVNYDASPFDSEYLQSLKDHLEENAGEEITESMVIDLVDDLRYTDSEALDEDDLREKVTDAIKNEVNVDRHSWKVMTYEALAEKNFSLLRSENRRHGPDNPGYIEQIRHDELEEIANWKVDEWDKYDSIEEAMEDVDKTRGWDKMIEERKNKNDITFLQENITQEFVDNNGYYTSETLPTSEGNPDVPVVTSVDAEEVRDALVFKFTNFGKPTIQVADANYDNEGGLLLEHNYNGVQLDKMQALATMHRLQNLWGRKVHLKTIEKEWDLEENDEILQELAMAQQYDYEMDWEDRIPEPDEVGKLITYDPDQPRQQMFQEEELPDEEIEHLKADDQDYNTIPEDWLA